MFYARNNNNRQEVNLNTNLFTSYSETAMIIAGAWNNQLSVKLKPCVGQDESGVRQYAEDRSQIISTSITPDNATCLIEGFEKEVLPVMNHEKEEGSASIVMGNAEARKILTIGYENGNGYLAISTGLNSDGSAQQTIRHEFNKKSYLVSYNPAEGNPVEQSVDVELIGFMDKVKAVKDLQPVIPHAIKYYDMVRGNFSANTQRPQQSAPKQVTDGGYSAPVSNANSMDDFLPFN